MGQKEILRTHLHVCGEDGTQRRVYKLKEEHEEGGSKKRKRGKKDINQKEENKRREKELY